jgi:hypothetical protein
MLGVFPMQAFVLGYRLQIDLACTLAVLGVEHWFEIMKIVFPTLCPPFDMMELVQREEIAFAHQHGVFPGYLASR